MKYSDPPPTPTPTGGDAPPMPSLARSTPLALILLTCRICDRSYGFTEAVQHQVETGHALESRRGVVQDLSTHVAALRERLLVQR